MLFPTYRVDPLTTSESGALRFPPERIDVGELQPLVVVWLHVVVENSVNVLLPELATNTSPADESSATASGPEPVGTEKALAKFEGSLVLPSLSTLTVLLDLFAMYRVPVDGSTA